MSTDTSEFISQFGDTLFNPSNDRIETKPSESLSGKDFIMLYFSAHWCPPCRRFTPKLIDFYNKLKADSKNVELVFCSLDKDEKEYEEYTSNMPWLCMPFDAKETKSMATKYKANGIPHLVVVDGASGEVITCDGTEEVMGDAEGTKFPWRPKSLKEIWGDEIQILSSNASEGSTIEYSSLKDKYLMLYFSAHWCPPCRAFTPTLSQAYTKLKSERDDFELVFISSDRSEKDFNEYFEEMTFCALPFEHRDTKSDLAKRYEVQGIPKLIMLGPVTDEETGHREVINDRLNGIINSGDFSDFPFHKKNYGPADEIDDPNQNKVLVVFHEGGDDDEQDDIKAVVKEVAEKLKNNKGMQFLWSFATTGIGPRIRDFAKLGDATSDPLMLLLDLPDGGAYYKKDTQNITVESLIAFVENPGDRNEIS